MLDLAESVPGHGEDASVHESEREQEKKVVERALTSAGPCVHPAWIDVLLAGVKSGQEDSKNSTVGKWPIDDA